jgi:hypothetical protein
MEHQQGAAQYQEHIEHLIRRLGEQAQQQQIEREKRSN